MFTTISCSLFYFSRDLYKNGNESIKAFEIRNLKYAHFIKRKLTNIN